MLNTIDDFITLLRRTVRSYNPPVYGQLKAREVCLILSRTCQTHAERLYYARIGRGMRFSAGLNIRGPVDLKTLAHPMVRRYT